LLNPEIVRAIRSISSA